MKRGFGLVVVGLASLFAAVVLLADAKSPQIELKDLKRTSLQHKGELITGVVRRGSDEGEVVIVYLDPTAVRFDFAFNPKRKPLRAVAPDAWMIVNAGYFTEDWKPTGLLAAGGRLLRKLEQTGGGAGSGVLHIEDGKVALLTRDEAKQVNFRNADLGLQAGPRIIEAGGVPGILSDDGARANRTVIGKDTRGKLVLAVFYFKDGGFASGPTLFELMGLLGEKGLGRFYEPAALTAALNLDGGPSTGAVLRSAKHRREFPTLSPVQHGLVIYGQRPAP